MGLPFTIIRSDIDQNIVFGWACVVTDCGVPVVVPASDEQGDVLTPAELMECTTAFMQSERIAKIEHDGDQIGEVVHSFPLTVDLAKSLGIDCAKEGWLVGVRVFDASVLKRILVGELKAFSIAFRCKPRVKRLPTYLEDVRLTELSLVHTPANNGAHLTLLKLHHPV